jgi:hypothetical protein
MKQRKVKRNFNINTKRRICNTLDNHYIHQIYVRTNPLRVFKVCCVSSPTRLVNRSKKTNK